MKRNYKSLLSIALVLVLVAITSLTFAYWDQLTGDGGGTVQIGEGKRIEVSAVVPVEEGRLIPADAVKGNNDKTSLTVSYNVSVTEFINGYDLDVIVNVTNDDTNVFKTTTTKTKTTDGYTVNIKFEFAKYAKSGVEGKDEITLAEYEKFANNPLAYTVDFEYLNTTVTP